MESIKFPFRTVVLDFLSDAVITFDPSGNILSWNKAAEKLYGWSAEEVINKNARIVLNSPQTSDELDKRLNMVAEAGELFLEVVHYSKDNRKIHIEAHTVPIRDENQNLAGFLTINRDISDRKEWEIHLLKEKERFQILGDLVTVFSKVTDDYQDSLDYTVRRLSEKMCDTCVIRMFNPDTELFDIKAFYHRDKEAYQFMKDMFANSRHSSSEGLTGQSFKSGRPILIPVVSAITGIKKEYKVYEEKYGLSSILFVPINDEGIQIGTISMIRDLPGNPFTAEDQLFLQNVSGKIGVAISKAKLFHKLSNALSQKEVLLKELYHRTKNNMQIIYSLLRLKGESVQDNIIKGILNEMGNRILTISLIHQKLYQSKDLSRIDLKEYINDLVHLLDQNYNLHTGKVRIRLNLESIPADIDMAIPCGLIVNELLSNAYKYAFPDETKGSINVSLMNCDGFIQLGVSDDGVGIPEGKDIFDNGSLGLELFKAIAEDQLKGQITVDTSCGFSCSVRFKPQLN